MNIPRYASSMVFVALLLSEMGAPALATTVGYGEDASQSVFWNAAGELPSLTPSNGRVSNTIGIKDTVVVYSEYCAIGRGGFLGYVADTRKSSFANNYYPLTIRG